MVCYLYKITNIVNGKQYIGLTSNPVKRKSQHFRDSRSKSIISKAIRKYGRENFEFEVLCKGSRPYIVDLEQKAIISYNTLQPNGYNIRIGGEDHGAGHRILKRSDDKFVYLSGFWFPNRRTALKSLSINEKTFHSRLKSNSTEEQIIKKNSVALVANYVGGFWFPDLLTASYCLNLPVLTLRDRIASGFVEAESKRSLIRTGENNPMFGVKGKDHPRARAILVQGEYFDSISDAVRQTNFTKSQIEKRLKKKVEGFEYFDPS